MTDVLASHYMAGVVGVALLRHWYEPEAENAKRMDELASILGALDEFPQNLPLNPTEHSVADGYRAWSEVYDGENPMIELEQSVMTSWLEDAVSQAGDGQVHALDAGCGTGRQAAILDGLGARVIGIDATPEMLDVARTKVPDAEFREGLLEELPCGTDSVDLAISSLAICHLDEPGPAVSELARCVRPGGTILISEPHPMVAALGGQAFYGGFDGQMNYVRNHHHGMAAWLNSFAAAGLDVAQCVELPYDPSVLESNPLNGVVGEALAAGFEGLPFILCFRLRVR